MRRDFEKYKGIPLGVIIKKDLVERQMTQKSLSTEIGMSYSKLNRILNGRGSFGVSEANRIETILDYEKSFIMGIQSLKDSFANKGDIDINASELLPKIRKCVFWDIDLASLDWIRHRRFIVERVSAYGDESERKMVERFYMQKK